MKTFKISNMRSSVFFISLLSQNHSFEDLTISLLTQELLCSQHIYIWDGHVSKTRFHQWLRKKYMKTINIKIITIHCSNKLVYAQGQKPDNNETIPPPLEGGEKQVHKVKNQTPKTIPKLLLNISSAELQWSLTQQTNVQNVNGGATASQFMRLVFALRPN